MKNTFSAYFNRLFFKKWTIGICRGNIEEMIRNKSFAPEILWFRVRSNNKFYADPFLLYENGKEEYKILLEDYTYNDHYGKISLVTFDNKLKLKNRKVLLDTHSHLSFPFVFSENDKIYIFPESGENKKLSCYEYDPENESITFLKDIIDLPLFDSTIIKHNDKYWIFGTLYDDEENYHLYVFFSDSLLGNYEPHPANPVKSGLNGIRSAGNFIRVDGEIYRPTQNCENIYGESITINKITELNETAVSEEPYMTINPDLKNTHNERISKIHTINSLNNIVIVDGMISVFAPLRQLKNSIKYRLQKRRMAH